ncbi:uncharacterized protein [Eucyclogobius newberryi]|uniref:uncharacterized protein isoform X2 n=1 Tax=Eucyclogobius newberryi TaxID=166745 RepID=UPI003B5A46C5
MSFPASFGSQLTAVMEALLKAVVAEVTAVVEDRVVELRLELRDRDREIREKQREIEQRDRHILDLRAAVEELRGREEAAVSPGEERPEQTESCSQQVWTKEEEEEEEEDAECLMKWETDFLRPPPSLLPAPLSSPADHTAPAAAAPPAAAPPPAPPSPAPVPGCSHDKSSIDGSFHAYSSPETEDFSQLPHADLAFDSPGSVSRALFHSITQQFSGFRCDQCGKTFTGKKRLLTHQSVHTGARPYICLKCGKRFTRSDSLVRHQKLDSCCK